MLTLHPHNLTLSSFNKERRRSHIYPGEGTFMIGFRLAGSITRSAARKVQGIVDIYNINITLKYTGKQPQKNEMVFAKRRKDRLILGR